MKPIPRNASLFRALAAPLALPLIGFVMAYAGDASAAVRTVGNCNDAGAGSLRAMIAAAASDDVIDLRGLTCSRIVLTSGQITIPQAGLTLLRSQPLRADHRWQSQ